MASEAQAVLGESIVKQLSDNYYEKRKLAAQQIEQRVRSAMAPPNGQGGGASEVKRILKCLKEDYIDSAELRCKKGGLIGLASVAIGLEGSAGQFVHELVPPALELFKDEDARVRYYACEAVYNIAKVATDGVLTYFSGIFDGLCRLYADVEQDVKGGVVVLDRLIKDIVTQSTNRDAVTRINFKDLLKARMQNRNPFIRQTVLAWIVILLKVPEVDMVMCLPEFLDGLFNMLGDQSRDIRHNADHCLEELLKTIKDSPSEKALQVISNTAGKVVSCCFQTDPCCRLTSLVWLHSFVTLMMDIAPRDPPVAQANETSETILPELLRGCLYCIDAEEEEIATMAVEMNNKLLEMVEMLRSNIPVQKLVDQLLDSMQPKAATSSGGPGMSAAPLSETPPVVRTACLQWIFTLLGMSRIEGGTLRRLFEPLFETLGHPDDEVVVATLTVMAKIMEGRKVEDDGEAGEVDMFTVVTHRLLGIFKADSQMLEKRGRLMIRQLCGHLDPRRLYITVAQHVQSETDFQFAQQLVQTFNWILLTAAETKSLREELIAASPLLWEASSTINGVVPSGVKPLFLELLEPWFHNPVSALSLCLWAQQYELAAELTARFATLEPTLDLLKQLDQLVHLLESPIFSRLRLRLLEPRKNPALLKCLLGLAMLLPQAGAFSILRERINVVHSGLLLDAQQAQQQEAQPDSLPDVSASSVPQFWWSGASGRKGKSDPGSSPDEVPSMDIESLLKRFDSTMARQC